MSKPILSGSTSSDSGSADAADDEFELRMTSRQRSSYSARQATAERSGATNKVKFLYLSSCSSAFFAAEDKEIIEKISILTLPEVAFYRSMDEWMDISLARLDSVPILSETFSTKVAEIFLAQDCSLMSAWSSLLNDKHE